MSLRKGTGLTAVALLLLVSTVELSFLLQSVAAQEEDAGVYGDGDTRHGNNWLDDCRSRGFDPWNLACTTCELLRGQPTPIHETCLRCCQSYKDGERQIRTKPYESAVLVLHRKTMPPGSELETFLAEDWDGLVAAKGADRLVSTRNKPPPRKEDRSMDLFLGLRSPMATLYFLEDKVDGNDKKVLDSVDEHARESIELDGWKRDDIKDMIRTLLVES